MNKKPTYNTGKPCKRGHLSDRYASGSCIECALLFNGKHPIHGKLIGNHFKPEIVDAVANGSLLYNTNEPCKNGHITHRYVSTGQCIECRRETDRVLRNKYPWKSNAYCALRKARKLQATPPWVEIKAIKEFYKNCPTGFHVDHIIPLKNPEVSGLHVLANLQYLTAEDNIKKGNNFSRSV